VLILYKSVSNLCTAISSTHHPSNRSRPSRSQPRHSKSPDYRRHLATFRLQYY